MGMTACWRLSRNCLRPHLANAAWCISSAMCSMPSLDESVLRSKPNSWASGSNPDAHEFGLDLSTLSSRDGIEHIALLMHQAALARCGRKQLRDSLQQAVMPIRHDQVNLGRSSCAEVLQETEPSLFAFLRTGSQCQHLFVAFLIHTQGRQNHGGIGLIPM